MSTQYDMLAKVIKFNRELMQEADYTAYAEGTEEYDMTYQIYSDASDALDNARRMAKYGVGSLPAPRKG